MPLLTIQSSQYESVPPGHYQTAFKSFDATETANGKAYRWTFSVTDGERKDKTISELSDAESPPTTKNKTGRFLAALAKASLVAGVSVDPDKYIGKRYLVICEAKDGGGSKIASFTML